MPISGGCLYGSPTERASSSKPFLRESLYQFRMLSLMLLDPAVLQSGLGVSFLIWSGEFKKIAGEFLSEFIQRFFFPQNIRACFSRVSGPPKSSGPKLSAFLSNFNILKPNLFHADVLLRGRPMFLFLEKPGKIPSVPKLLTLQNLIFWTINFGRRNLLHHTDRPGIWAP